MPRTLFILDDRVFQSISEPSRNAMLVELDKIFAFIQGFKVKPTIQSKFPQNLDLSDSVIRIVETGSDGSSVINQAFRKQHQNVRIGIKKAGFKPPPVDPLGQRFAGIPDRHGEAFHAKQVQPAGNQKLAMPFMAGWVALDSIKQEADEFTDQHIRPQTPFPKSIKYWASKDALADTRKSIDLLGRYLARTIAHEARHQYVLPHAATKLGTDGPVFEDGNDTRFSPDDQTEIRKAIESFEAQQRGAILIAMIPSPEAFPF